MKVSQQRKNKYGGKENKFHFRKRGRLAREEERDLISISKNLFDWVKVKELIELKELEEDGNDKWMCKGILEEGMENVATSKMEKEVDQRIEEVLGAAMEESMIKEIMSEIQ